MVDTFFVFKAELRASVFEAIEEEDRAIEKDEGLPPALLGSCNDRAKKLHSSPSGSPPKSIFQTIILQVSVILWCNRSQSKV